MFGLQNEQAIVYALMACAAVAIFLVIIMARKNAKNALQAEHIMLQKKLRDLNFVYAVLCERGQHIVGSDRVWCDASHTVVISQKGEPCALIGFTLSKDSVSVLQMQGIRGKKLFGVDLGPFLLSYAEMIARQSQKTYLRVQPAREHDYFELSEESYMYPQLYAHQRRMRAIYDASPKASGYEEPSSSYRWWQKTLRKKLTFKRWLLLLELTFNRQMRQLKKDVPQDDLFAAE